MWTRRFLSSWQWGTISGQSLNPPVPRPGERAIVFNACRDAFSSPAVAPFAEFNSAYVFDDFVGILTKNILNTLELMGFDPGFSQPSLTGLDRFVEPTQHCVLGYTQSSLARLFLLLPPAMACPFGKWGFQDRRNNPNVLTV